MSYTLRGRIESRLAGVLVPFLGACIASVAVQAWWPVELAAAMVGTGLALDLLVYHRLLAYQPGWAAIPLGLLELGATMALVRALGVAAPLEPAIWFFIGSWIVAQVVGHAGLPLLRLSYAEDGGELGRGGVGLSALAVAAPVAVLGVASAMQPPLVRLEAGVHQGPLVLDHPQRLVGDEGAVVRGGIMIRADDVTVRNVTVIGGENGVDVDEADDVILDRVRVLRSGMDGIHVRRSQVTIRNCEVLTLASDLGQGIDISFSAHRDPSLVEDCRIEGAWEGIVTHSAQVMVRENHVRATTSRAIAVTEMSMGHVEQNEIVAARGIGIFCGDYSMCSIERNRVSGTRPDHTTEDAMRDGYAIQAHFHAEAEVDGNHLTDNVHDQGIFAGARIEDR